MRNPKYREKEPKIVELRTSLMMSDDKDGQCEAIHIGFCTNFIYFKMESRGMSMMI